MAVLTKDGKTLQRGGKAVSTDCTDCCTTTGCAECFSPNACRDCEDSHGDGATPSQWTVTFDSTEADALGCLDCSYGGFFPPHFCFSDTAGSLDGTFTVGQITSGAAGPGPDGFCLWQLETPSPLTFKYGTAAACASQTATMDDLVISIGKGVGGISIEAQLGGVGVGAVNFVFVGTASVPTSNHSCCDSITITNTNTAFGCGTSSSTVVLCRNGTAVLSPC